MIQKKLIMKKQYYFFDLDDTLFDTKDKVIAYLNTTYKLSLDPSKYYCGNGLFEIVTEANKDIHITRKVFWDRYREEFLMSHQWHKQVAPMEHMVEVVQTLAKYHHCHIVTARQSPGISVVKALIDTYIPECISAIHFVNQYHTGSFTKVLKSEYIAEYRDQTCLFIDDNIGEFNGVKDIVPSYLFDPQDHHPEIPSSMKFSSWAEIGKQFL